MPILISSILQPVDHHARIIIKLFSSPAFFPIGSKNSFLTCPHPGSDEGIYAWVTANYALGTLGSDPQKTTGIIELGGASAQVFLFFTLLITFL